MGFGFADAKVAGPLANGDCCCLLIFAWEWSMVILLFLLRLSPSLIACPGCRGIVAGKKCRTRLGGTGIGMKQEHKQAKLSRGRADRLSNLANLANLAGKSRAVAEWRNAGSADRRQNSCSEVGECGNIERHHTAGQVGDYHKRSEGIEWALVGCWLLMYVVCTSAILHLRRQVVLVSDAQVEQSCQSSSHDSHDSLYSLFVI